jgi:hypothetical protein
MGQAKNRDAREERLKQAKPRQQPQWQPLSMLPMLADLLDKQLEDVQNVLDALREARSRPHVMDDYTISRVIISYTEQREFILEVYPDQAARWLEQARSTDQRTAVERFLALTNQVVAAFDEALALACEISPGTIDKILGKPDTELAKALLKGETPFPDVPANARELQAEERRKIATVLDLRMRALIDAKCTDEEILVGMQDYMTGFRRLMDTSGHDELNRLLRQFPGLHRFAKLLETLAAKIQAGEIKVPKSPRDT